jgi:hypothetical protein
MHKTTYENVVFVLFEHFQVKAFHFQLQANNYVFKEVYPLSIPLLWKKSPTTKIQLAKDILSDIAKHIGEENIGFKVVSDDSDLADLTSTFPLQVYIAQRKDYALVPYFSSAFIGAYEVGYAHMSYYNGYFIDNHGKEFDAKWNTWQQLAKHIRERIPQSSEINMDTWMNNLVRPVIGESSFYLSAIGALMLRECGVSLEKTTEGRTFIAGGELFSWMSDPNDVLFAILVGISHQSSFVAVYHDIANILSCNRALKETSLHTLELATGRFVGHIGDIVTIKARKSVKPTNIVGRINVYDEEGVKTLYPVPEDILAVSVKGPAKVVLDLHFPFYVDGDVTSFHTRNRLIIDTRIKDRSDMANFKAWHDRIKRS